MTDFPQDPDGQDPIDEERDSDTWRSRMVPEAVKRLLVAGIGALFTSEEGIRRLASEFSLPKDVAHFLITQGRSTKNELFRIMAREFREFLNSINLGQEITKALTSLTFEIKMQVRLLPNERQDAVRPNVKGSIKVQRSGEPFFEEP